MDAYDFFNALYGTTQGTLSLWRSLSKASYHLNYPLNDHDNTVMLHMLNDGNGGPAPSSPYKDLYYGVCLRAPGLGLSQRGTKAQLTYAPGVFFDIDIADPGAHVATNLPPDLDAALDLVGALPLEPNILVHSGYGLHGYTLFDTPLDVSSKYRAEGYEAAVLHPLRDHLARAAAAKGWHVDTGVFEAARVLRVPGTYNYKHPAAPKQVVVIHDDLTKRTPFGDMAALLTGRTSVAVPASLPVAATTPAENIAAPPVPVDILKARMVALKDKSKAAMFSDLLAGRSFAKAQRDDAMQRLCSTLAFMAPDNAVDDLAELFRASVGVWAAEPGAKKSVEDEMSKVRDKLTRAMCDARDDRNVQATQDKAIMRVLEIKAATAPMPEGAYTPAELNDLAKLARCHLKDLPKRWIIQKGLSYYVLSGWRYAGPFMRAELDVGLRQYLRAAPIRWTYADARGKNKERPVADILGEHCTVAERLRATLTLQTSFYDANTGTFNEAVCPLRPLNPTFHLDVQSWLEKLGGTEKERLLDWVATVTDLENYTCALYLSGPPGTGKTLLATGLARLWTEGPPAELDRVLGDFNDELVRCPLVLADEALPTNWRGKQTSTELRRLTGSSSRTLSRKYVASAELHGAIRLILAANNERLLAFDEDMSQEDIRAMSERVLHIDTTAAGQPDRATVSDWVSKDRIAEHALWLRETRMVVASGRWLVSGHTSRIHQNMPTRSRVAGNVTEWLAKHLAEPSSAVPTSAAVRVGDGRFLVNTQVVSTYWGIYIQHDKVPDTGRLGRALKNLSKGQHNLTPTIKAHDIDVELVYRWADENQIGDVAAMRESVEAASVPAPVAPPPQKTIRGVLEAVK